MKKILSVIFIIKSYLPYVYSGAIKAVLFTLMSSFSVSDFASRNLPSVAYIILPIVMAVLSAMILYGASVKSSGNSLRGYFIGFVSSVIILFAVILLKTYFNFELFKNTSGDDPGNLMFMVVWMIYFPAALVFNGMVSVFGDDE